MFDDEGLPRWLCYIKLVVHEPEFQAHIAWFKADHKDKRRKWKNGVWIRQSEKEDSTIQSEQCACFKVQSP